MRLASDSTTCCLNLLGTGLTDIHHKIFSPGAGEMVHQLRAQTAFAGVWFLAPSHIGQLKTAHNSSSEDLMPTLGFTVTCMGVYIYIK